MFTKVLIFPNNVKPISIWFFLPLSLSKIFPSFQISLNSVLCKISASQFLNTRRTEKGCGFCSFLHLSLSTIFTIPSLSIYFIFIFKNFIVYICINRHRKRDCIIRVFFDSWFFFLWFFLLNFLCFKTLTVLSLISSTLHWLISCFQLLKSFTLGFL